MPMTSAHTDAERKSEQMDITQKTYISFAMPKDYESLCKFEQENDLTNAKKYEDTIFVTYEFISHWQTEREGE